MENGFIVILRQILKWEWYDDVNTCRLFLHLLLTVNWEDGRWHGMEVKRGQRITSLSKLADETHLSVQSVRTSIEHLKSTGEVTSESHSNFSLLTVTKYDEYQDPNKLFNKRPTNDQQTTNNNITRITKKQEEQITTSNVQRTAFDEIVEYFNLTCSTDLKLTPKKRTQLKERLKVFDIGQVKRAILLRTEDAWYSGENATGKVWFKDWDSLFRNDEKIEHILNMSSKEVVRPVSDEDAKRNLLNF